MQQMLRLTRSETDPRIEILGRIRDVFTQKGFDGASMQDLARAAGMSAGNFYRYFPSKDAIVEAMVAWDLAEIEEQFAEVMAADDAVAALRRVVAERIDGDDTAHGDLWAEIEAASLRRPEVAAVTAHLKSRIGSHLISVFARISGVGDKEAAARFGAHATLFMVLVKGTVIENCGQGGSLRGKPTPELKALVLRMIDTLIEEIAAAGPHAADTRERKE